MIIDTLKSRASGSFAAAKDKDKNDLKIACLLVPASAADFQETPY